MHPMVTNLVKALKKLLSDWKNYVPIANPTIISKLSPIIISQPFLCAYLWLFTSDLFHVIGNN